MSTIKVPEYPFTIRHLSKEEGVSLNTLVITMLAESLGEPTHKFTSSS